MNRKLFCTSDLAVIALILLISLTLGFYLYSADAADTAEIYKDSALIATVGLNENSEFTLPEAEGFVFSVYNHSIGIKSSPCKNKVCVGTGYISKGSETVVCLPERLCVRAVSHDGYDAVIG